MKYGKYIEGAIVIGLYILMCFLYTSTFRNDQIPYGETDASIHYFIAHSAYNRGYVSIKETDGNTLLGFNSSRVEAYPPPFHAGLITGDFLGRGSVVGFYSWVFIICSLVYFSLYLVIRKMYGIPAAMMCAVFMVFSMRNMLTYLWGQWATSFAIAFMPVVLYLYYLYTVNEKARYFYLMACFLALTMLAHAVIFVLTTTILIVYTLTSLIMKRKFPFKFKHLGIAVLIFLVVFSACAPLQVSYMATRLARAAGLVHIENYGAAIILKEGRDTGLARVFGWYNLPFNIEGQYPPQIFQFNYVYYSWLWIIPLVSGLVFLFFRHKMKDIMMLSTVAGFYIITHLDVI